MSGDGLDRGFVTWQGRRVFVPWLGAPRIVPSAEDEARVLKNRFRLDWVPVGAIVLLFGLGAWIINLGIVVALIYGLMGVYTAGILVERRRIRDWPLLTNARFARALFLRHYFRGLPLGERVSALLWSGLGAVIVIQALSDFVPAAVKTATRADLWSCAVAAGMLGGLLMLGFLSLRHLAIVLLSLKSAEQRAPVVAT